MAKNIIAYTLVMAIWGAVSVAPGKAEICETHDFGSGSVQYNVYSPGRVWNFAAVNDMLIESIEVKSVLATEYSGTFHIRIEVNNTVVSVMDQYVHNTTFQAYIHSENVSVNLQKGDKITYRIYGNFRSDYLGAILGPNYVMFCGTGGVKLSPPSLRDDFLTLVDAFDSPNQNPYGLAFDGTYLWHMGLLGKAVYKIDTSGNVIHSFDFPGYLTPGDLAFDGTNLWVTDFIEAEIHQLSTSGDLITTIDSPARNPSGLTSDGTHLWVTSSNTAENTVYQIDTSGNVIHSFGSPGNGYKGLAFDGTYLWHVDVTSKISYKFDLEGNTMAAFHLPATGDSLGPRGLASDDTSLWYSNHSDGKIYRLAFPHEVSIGSSKRQTFEFTVTGTENVAINTLSITNGDGYTFRLESDDCSGRSLSPSDSCTFDILFAPKSPGDKSATLLMPINIPDHHDVNVPLKWTAVEKFLTVYVNSIGDCGHGNEPCYAKIQESLEEAGDHTVRVKIAQGQYDENVTAATNGNYNLLGGYDTGFAKQTGMSTIYGDLTIEAGSLVVENLDITNH